MVDLKSRSPFDSDRFAILAQGRLSAPVATETFAQDDMGLGGLRVPIGDR
jgi:hypothetical protein